MKIFISVVVIVFAITYANAEEVNKDKIAKVLPIFQVVKFPNDPCDVSGGSKNGTCYTAEECSNKGGSNEGSCANGFGVCCTFTLGCGSTTTENCTYFESSTTVNTGPCATKVCKSSSDVCQIRLDFNTFTITGPSTVTTSVGQLLMGGFDLTAGVDVGQAGRCLTDTFSISNQRSVPTFCGTNTNAHVYFDASDACNEIAFQFGNNANGVSAAATRSFSIKITQISCFSDLLAPQGCTQYYYGSGATNYVRTFNFDGSPSRHLSDQKQTICVRRESGNCRICWSADASADFGTSLKTNKASNKMAGTSCFDYGADGKKITSGGYDGIMIPGAAKTDGTRLPDSQCGQKGGLATASAIAAMSGKTVCSKSLPFRVRFGSDTYEAVLAMGEIISGVGFKLRYFQTTC